MSEARGFTLIEMMAVIVVIVILGAVLVPMVMNARKAARNQRIRADLATIATALEAYKQDFLDYPRLSPVADPNGVASGNRGVYGSQLLCWALIGPAGARKFGDPPNTYDGADGPGFRLRLDVGGKVYGPYVPPERFKVRPPYFATVPQANWNMCEAEILDVNGYPILYYPARNPKLNIHVANGYVSDPSQIGFANPMQPVFNAAHNDRTNRVSLAAMQFKLQTNPAIPTAAKPGSQGVGQLYILWSAGNDGVFGKDEQGSIQKMDDVTNVDQ